MEDRVILVALFILGLLGTDSQSGDKNISSLPGTQKDIFLLGKFYGLLLDRKEGGGGGWQWGAGEVSKALPASTISQVPSVQNGNQYAERTYLG